MNEMNDKVIAEGDGKALLKENNAQIKEKLKREENEKEECKRGERWKDRVKKGREAQGRKGDGEKKQLKR